MLRYAKFCKCYAFEQLCLLQEARQQIQADLQDKNIALGIDVDQYNLTDRSSNISFKPDSLRVLTKSLAIIFTASCKIEILIN
jgi:tektin-2